MRIFADKLVDNLARKLNTLYFVMGNEPLLIQESRDAINAAAKANGFEDKHRFALDNQLNWDDVYECCQALSLFSNLQVIELEIPDAGVSATHSKGLIQLASYLNSDILVIIIANKLSRAQENSKWFKALQPQGALVVCNSPDLRQLPQFVAQRCRKLKLNADNEAVQMLAQWHEGNLLALKQSLDKLVLLYPDGQLTLLRIEDGLSRQNHFTPFQWSDALLAGQAKRSQRILRQLEAEGQEAIILLRTVQKELVLLFEMQNLISQNRSIGQIFDQYHVWQNKRPLYQAALQRLNITKLQRLIYLLTQLELSVKTTFTQDQWPQLHHISLEFCQPSSEIPSLNDLI